MNKGFKNYHTHTPRCMHARDTEEEFVRSAIENGFDVLGFADHTPWPYKSDFVAGMRMPITAFDGYLGAIRDVKNRYASEITIHAGLECEAFPEFFPWLKQLLENGTVDYLLLGNHYDTTDEYHDDFYFGRCSTDAQIERYRLTTIKGMESGLFSYLCHPDLYLNRCTSITETAEKAAHDICKTAQRLDMPLEFNLLGYHRQDPSSGYIGYTTDFFWSVAEQYKIRAIIGVDAHTPEQLRCTDEYIQIRNRLESRGINVIDSFMPAL